MPSSPSLYSAFWVVPSPDLQERGVFNRDELSRKAMGTLQQWVVGMIYIGDDKNSPLRI